MSSTAIPVVTCTVYYNGKFLVIRRHDKAKKFGGLWTFPGGKVEQGETIAGAIIREVKEETDLDLTDKLLFSNSYYYGDSLGMHFVAFSTSDNVSTEQGVEFKWLSDLAGLQQLPRIPGVDYHIVHAQELLNRKTPYLSFSEVDYIPEKYIN